MNKIKENLKNNKFLALVVLTYLALLIIMPGKAIESFNNSLYYVKEMLIIMPVVLLLTSLIEVWVPKKTIENTLGKDSGIKGPIFSLLLGSFSAGPIYAAFPVCKTLLKKGASISNIVIILSAWAVIKVPMLANEAKFLGPKFMALRWGLTTTSIFIMAYLIAKMVKKKDMPKDEIYEGEKEKLYIDKNYCIGCGVCERISPKQFNIVNKKAVLINENGRDNNKLEIEEAIDKCPAKAIKYI